MTAVRMMRAAVMFYGFYGASRGFCKKKTPCNELERRTCCFAEKAFGTQNNVARQTIDSGRLPGQVLPLEFMDEKHSKQHDEIGYDENDPEQAAVVGKEGSEIRSE